jgi:hypothetical protein
MSTPKRRYAQDTDVPVDRSLTEIQRLLVNYGCRAFQQGWEEGADGGRRELLSFETRERRVRFVVPIPPLSHFLYPPESDRKRGAVAQRAAHDQERRRLWRALTLSIKAKLAAIDAEIATFDEEFLAYTVLPDNRTVAEWAGEQLDATFRQMPPLLPGAPRQLGPGPGQTSIREVK